MVRESSNKDNDSVAHKDSTTPPSPATNNAVGLAWVNGGKIHVLNPTDGGNKATVTPCAEITMLINGQPVVRKTEVSAEDEIKVTPLYHNEPGFLKVLISPDKLSAFIEYKPEVKITSELIETQPVSNLILKAVNKKEITFNESRDSILELLKKNQVSYGIDLSAIANFTNHPIEGLTLIAKGQPPGQSTDDHITLLFEQHINKLVENHLGTVDFKELSSIPSVSNGEIIAKKISGKQGDSGTTVTNQSIKAKDPKTINLLAGSGVEIINDGLEVIAAIDGLPKVKKSNTTWVFSVDPVLTITGDVNVKTGNIRFKGNVNIAGSVESDMSVSANGNIAITNLATNCNITAGGNITINGNIVNAEIVSGGYIVLCNSVKAYIKELLSSLQDMFISANLMAEKLPVNSKVLYGNILVLLIEKKFIHFPSLLEKVQKKLKELDLKLIGQYEYILQKALVSLSGINILQYKTSLEFQTLLTNLHNFIEYADNLQNNRSMVTIKVALNSVIKSSGDVYVSGGCFNTHIVADGNVKINGIVRGGIIQAGDDVLIKEIGSELGTKSVVIVPKNKKINIGKSFEGVTVQFGKITKVIDKKMSNIEIILDEEGYINIK